MKFIKTLLVFPLILLLGEGSIAQVQQTMTFDASTSLLIREFNAMIVQSDDLIRVEMNLGNHSGSSSATSDDLQRGDLILMMNGERINDIAGMREIYENIPNAEEIKIGVRRGEERFIVRAIKGDIPETPAGQMVMSFDTELDAQPVVIAELGMLVATVDGSIRIQNLIEPLLPKELASDNLEGFNIISLNGKGFDTAEAFQEFMATIEVGENLNLLVEKDGDELGFNLPKPRARGSISISADN